MIFMKKQACEQLTLFPEASPASPFPWLESKKEKGMIVTCGQKCCELSGNLRQLGLLVRTYLESLELPLKRYYRIWKVQAIGRQSLIMKLRLREHGTEETGYSLWPTVTCMDSRPAKSKEGLTREMAVRPGRKMPSNLRDCVHPESMKLWATPRASDGKGIGTIGSASAEHQLKKGQLQAVALYATKRENLNDQIDGQLNPEWVEWLMGFPIGWTESRQESQGS
jgi:hypothetical protein